MAENVLSGRDGDGDGTIDITEWETRMHAECQAERHDPGAIATQRAAAAHHPFF
jgi:hypothetical protein